MEPFVACDDGYTQNLCPRRLD